MPKIVYIVYIQLFGTKNNAGFYNSCKKAKRVL